MEQNFTKKIINACDNPLNKFYFDGVSKNFPNNWFLLLLFTDL